MYVCVCVYSDYYHKEHGSVLLLTAGPDSRQVDVWVSRDGLTDLWRESVLIQSLQIWKAWVSFKWDRMLRGWASCRTIEIVSILKSIRWHG